MTHPRALLLTDVVDSTGLALRIGDAAMARVWAAHDRAARDLLPRWQGREIDKTDGMLLLFDAASDAVAYAIAYQQALRQLMPPLEARAGLHVGPVTLRENGPADVALGAKPLEVEGLAKATAARIMSVAIGGQILLSADARHALSADGLRLQSHGHWRLKGLDQPIELFEVGDADAPFTPPPDADKAYRVVADGTLWRPRRSIPTNLGAERDAFVGRGAELLALGRSFDAGARLLTVLGPGGSGKTRLVRRYGRAWLGDWPGGVYFCDLSEARTRDGVLFAVAAALSVPLASDDAVAQLGHAITARGRCLLILDNFEQVAALAPAVLAPWLDRSIEAAFVVTSRERLHLAGERLLALEPLALASEAIELFEVRARAHRPEFAVGDDNRTAVAEIVRLLDGLPLAIELAVARLRVLSPAQLVTRLQDRFSVLAGARGAAARQATLRAVIDWSWQLLNPWEQAALAQCSVFEGGFTLTAAEAVLDLSRWPDAPPVIDAIQALVDKSLLRSWVQASGRRVDIGEPYFGMYLSIHEYAAQRLRGDAAAMPLATEQRHGRHFAGFGSAEAIEALHTHGGVQRRALLASELDNVVAACRRGLARGDGAVAAATFRAAWSVLDLQGPIAIGVELGMQVLALDGLDAGSRIAVAQMLGPALRRIGRPADARACLEAALALARNTHDRRAEAGLLQGLGTLDTFEGRTTEGRVLIEAAIDIHRETGARRLEGAALGTLAVLLHDIGRLDEALPRYEMSLAIQREAGDRFAEGIVLGNLATLHNDQGRLAEARAMYQATIAVCREIGDREGDAITLGNLGKLELDMDRLDDALAAYEPGLRIAREVGSRRTEGVILGQLGIVFQRLQRADDARAHYAPALAIAREIGNRRFEGQVLSSLGELAREQGNLAGAAALLAEAETLLRAIDDRMDLGEVLCIRGCIDLQRGDRAAAEAALAEAEAGAASLGVEPASGLGQGIARLRAALAAPA